MDDKKTMTAEEVERRALLVRDGLLTTPCVNPRNDVWLPALGELAAQAARVPEMEKELAKAFACCGGNDATPPEHTQDCDAAKPAPAQGSKHLRDVLALAAKARMDALLLFAAGRELDALESRAPPTPPPGLREALGKAFAPLLDPRQLGDMLSSDPVALTALRGISGAQMDVLLTWLEQRILAAYDATGGEDWGPKMQDDLRAVLTLAQTGEAGDHQTPLGARAVAAVRALHEDAAKYRAAVERIDEAVERMPSIAEGQVRDVLEWMLEFDGMPVPATLDKARVVEVLRDLAMERMDRTTPYQTGWVDALSEVATRLALTFDWPPFGPGGGNPKAVNREAFDKVYGEAARRWDAAFDRHEAKARARIVPTPTSEVPPLQPTAPAVVWQGDGLKVKADGSVWDTHEHRAPWQVTELLARALAEAKREVAEAAQQAIRRFASRLGDDATGHDTDRSLEELEVALYQHVMEEEDKARTQAAEAMRERAAQAAKTARHRVLVTDESFSVYAMACEDIEISIRRIPLE